MIHVALVSIERGEKTPVASPQLHFRPDRHSNRRSFELLLCFIIVCMCVVDNKRQMPACYGGRSGLRRTDGPCQG